MKSDTCSQGGSDPGTFHFFPFATQSKGGGDSVVISKFCCDSLDTVENGALSFPRRSLRALSFMCLGITAEWKSHLRLEFLRKYLNLRLSTEEMRPVGRNEG